MSHAGFRRLRTSVNTPMCKQVYTTLWWLRSTPTALASLSCIETAPVSVNETPEARKTDNTTRKQYKERRLAKDRSFEQLAPVVKRLKVPSNLNNQMCNCCATRYL
ncbi:hypothetical protein T01_11511 [Trichinella spiralis]|uniref:Uncharacterized protein n=1 Tax=Trichinella spiralis TaxID=6334 RepID=A0A0V1BA66_TRISP|nr:hypothetical protein T01_11511 [Trichinella spiralis]